MGLCLKVLLLLLLLPLHLHLLLLPLLLSLLLLPLLLLHLAVISVVKIKKKFAQDVRVKIESVQNFAITAV